MENNRSSYTKSAEFLCAYSWEGKTKEQIIKEMALPDYEQVYLEDAMRELAPQKKFTGWDLDRYILQRLDMEEDDDFDPDDVIFLDR